MQKIHILDPHEVQKIAAGEVIERPVGVLKECIENSLDAGATTIQIFVEKTGKQLIRIVDNGSGIDPEDLPKTILPFATSKIERLNDLEQIKTFGFRGEALASIAAISKLTLRSREQSAEIGHEIIVHASSVINENKVAMQAGTEILIEDLFFNTPVRKKFLRADETEWHAMQQIIHAFCLSNLHVNFTVFRDNKIFLQAPAVDSLQDRICQIWGLSRAQHMALVHHENKKENILVTGIISDQTVHRYNRQQILYFINGRLIKNNSMANSIIKGYGPTLPSGRFPIAVLLITMDGIGIDVNIHPRKEEVRFVRPGIVDNTVTDAVRSALEEQGAQLVQSTLAQDKTEKNINTFFSEFHASRMPTKPDVKQNSATPFQKILDQQKQKPLTELFKHDSVITFKNVQQSTESYTNPAINTSIKQDFTDNTTIQPTQKIYYPEIVTQEHQHAIPAADFILPRLVGQIDKTYIILESDDQMIMIDQHAAHERILYERWTATFEKKEGSRLLFPETIQLNAVERAFILELKDFFAQQGFEIETLGPNNIVVYSAPPQIQGVNIVSTIHELAALHDACETLTKEELRKKLNEHMHSHLACKTAIKAGDVLSPAEQLQLVKDLFHSPNRHMCIHGRPTMWKMPKSDIAKKFKRPTE